MLGPQSDRPGSSAMTSRYRRSQRFPSGEHPVRHHDHDLMPGERVLGAHDDGGELIGYRLRCIELREVRTGSPAVVHSWMLPST